MRPFEYVIYRIPFNLRGRARIRKRFSNSPISLMPLRSQQAMNTITTKDGTRIHYKDWGSGQPVILSHGWPLNADSWEAQAFHLASNGFRVIAHDRRGHGRSSQPSFPFRSL